MMRESLPVDQVRGWVGEEQTALGLNGQSVQQKIKL